jgi:hypothetical protein
VIGDAEHFSQVELLFARRTMNADPIVASSIDTNDGSGMRQVIVGAGRNDGSSGLAAAS